MVSAGLFDVYFHSQTLFADTARREVVFDAEVLPIPAAVVTSASDTVSFSDSNSRLIAVNATAVDLLPYNLFPLFADKGFGVSKFDNGCSRMGVFDRYSVSLEVLNDVITYDKIITRSVSDTVSFSDSVVRALALAPAITDSLPTTEQVTKTIAFSRTTTDELGHILFALFDANVYLKSGFDPVANVAGIFDKYAVNTDIFNENARRLVNNPRTDVLTLSFSDTSSRIIHRGVDIVDSFTFTDSNSKIQSLPRSPTESVPTTESAASICVHNRAVSETVAFSDIAAQIFNLPRSATDSEAFNESAVRSLQHFTRTTSDTLTFSDSPAAPSNHSRTVTDTAPTFSDNVTRAAQPFTRTDTDTFPFLENLNALPSLPFLALFDNELITSYIFKPAVTHTAWFDDDVSTEPSHGVAQDSAILSDSISTLSGRTRTITDTNTFSETLVGLPNLPRTVTDTVSFSDTATVIRSFSRAIADAPSFIPYRLFDTKSPKPSTFDSNIISGSWFDKCAPPIPVLERDSATANIGINRTVTDTSSFSDSVVRALQLIHTATDTVSFSDSVSRLLALIRSTQVKYLTLFDTKFRRTLAFDSDLSIIGWFDKKITVVSSDTYDFSDSPSTLAIHTRVLNDFDVLAGVFDSLNRKDKLELFDKTYFPGVRFDDDLLDIPPFSDILVRDLQSTVRSITESFPFSEALVAIETAIRSITDSSTFSDSFTTLSTRIRKIYDAITPGPFDGLLDPTKQELFDKTYDLGAFFDDDYLDTIHITDLASSHTSATRTASDSSPASDSVDTTATHVRTTTDTLVFSDTGTSASAHQRSLLEGVIRGTFDGLLDVPKAELFDPTISEGVRFDVDLLGFPAVTDTVNANKSLPRTAIDSLTFSDSVGASGPIARTATDTLSFSDSVSKACGLARQTTDTVTTSDSVTALRGLVRSCSDILTFSDSASCIISKARTTTDTLTFSDSVSKLVALIRSATDTLTLTDSTSARAANFTGDTTDTFTVSDSTVALTSVARSATDTVSFSDTTPRLISFSRTATDTLTFSDTASKTQAISRLAVDVPTNYLAFSLFDNSALNAALFAPIGQSLASFDTYGITYLFADRVTAALTHGRTCSDTVSFSDTTSARVSLARSTTDTKTFTDTTSKLVNLPRNVSDSTTTSDSIVALATGSISDTLTYSDSAGAKVALHRSASTAVAFSDHIGELLPPVSILLPAVFDPEIVTVGEFSFEALLLGVFDPDLLVNRNELPASDIFSVDHNFGGTGALLVNAPDPDKFKVYVFGYHDWTIYRITKPIDFYYCINRARVHSDGTWETPILLPPGKYTIIAISLGKMIVIKPLLEL